MPKTTRERVALYRLRKEAEEFYEKYLSDELVTVPEFVSAMAEADCNRGGFAQVKYPKETLAAFKEALCGPKRGEEIHYEDLYLAWHKIRGESA